jgi:hypothetical protein
MPPTRYYSLAITKSIFVTEIHSVLDQPVGIMDGFRCPLGTWMVPESALGGAVRRLIRLVKGSIPMIPIRRHYGQHLAAFQRHLDDVLVGKADGALRWKFVCYKNVHNN